MTSKGVPPGRGLGGKEALGAKGGVKVQGYLENSKGEDNKLQIPIFTRIRVSAQRNESLNPLHSYISILYPWPDQKALKLAVLSLARVKDATFAKGHAGANCYFYGYSPSGKVVAAILPKFRFSLKF